MKDLADVLELIKLLSLPSDFGTKLNPYVQAKFLELWEASRGNERRYVCVWHINSLAARVQSIDSMIAGLTDAADTLRKMRDDGVMLDLQGGTSEEREAMKLISTPTLP